MGRGRIRKGLRPDSYPHVTCECAVTEQPDWPPRATERSRHHVPVLTRRKLATDQQGPTAPAERGHEQRARPHDGEVEQDQGRGHHGSPRVGLAVAVALRIAVRAALASIDAMRTSPAGGLFIPGIAAGGAAAIHAWLTTQAYFAQRDHAAITAAADDDVVDASSWTSNPGQFRWSPPSGRGKTGKRVVMHWLHASTYPSCFRGLRSLAPAFRPPAGLPPAQRRARPALMRSEHHTC